jgi:signal transduction histidine kinase
LAVSVVLETDERLPSDVRDDMRMIRRNAEMEVRLVDDLLDLNAVARGKLSLRPEVADAHLLIEEVLGMCRRDAEEKDVALEAWLAAGRHHIYGDVGRLRQVVWNLLRNALKFTPAGGRVTVTTSDAPDSTLCIEVSDTGIGIDPQALARIFSAFEQADETVTQRFGGLGLGLAIAKSLVESHRGTLQATSQGKGRGATFTVRLPIEPPDRPGFLPTPRAAVARPPSGDDLSSVGRDENAVRSCVHTIPASAFTFNGDL